MDEPHRKGAEDARNQLPRLLESAEQGQATIITRHGRPVAVVGPVGLLDAPARQAPLTPLEGSGRGLWREDSRRTLGELRDEWPT
jgi:prevent-host-death family protein